MVAARVAFAKSGDMGEGWCLVIGLTLSGFVICPNTELVSVSPTRSSGRSHILSNLVGGLMPEDVRRGGGLDHWHDEQACRQRHINSRV